MYGLFHHLARTPQGKRLLRQYFLRPTLDVGVIDERLESVSVFSQPENSVSIRTIVKSLNSVKDMRTVMVHLRKGISDGTNKGGIRSGIWSTLRLVSRYQKPMGSIAHAFIVCLPFTAGPGHINGSDWY